MPTVFSKSSKRVLVQSASSHDGQARPLPTEDTALRELDVQTPASVHHAVVVLRDEDKAGAREHFITPLVFSVREAKGLEYPHVILYARITHRRAAYAQVCNGVPPADLTVEELSYNRAGNKSDTSRRFITLNHRPLNRRSGADHFNLCVSSAASMSRLRPMKRSLTVR